MRRATVLWLLLATSGVMLVAGVTLAASTLSTQSIGLSSEPPSAGDELAPQESATATPRTTATPASERRRDRVHGPSRTATPAADPTATARPPVATVDDDGDDDNSGSGSDSSGHGSGGDDDDGSGRGRGRGRGGDDDD